MYKRMLRSALAVVFSVVAVIGAVVAGNGGDAGSAQAGGAAQVEPKGKTDLGWDSSPADLGWDAAAAKVS
ncbi:hypothetical protein ACQKM2_10005 [Streptomyces sp. NPDC004126]|uniref:hypothetical protein n=1 Tax=Streptomyces sp. NPDC004126 TaxID=3390695 RepID=UPI003D03B413